MIKLDGFEDCVAGVVSRCGEEDIFCYDQSRILEKLKTCGMTEDDAYEFFCYNIAGAWFGCGTPCFLVAERSEDDAPMINRVELIQS